ncbi:MAG: hypothetical protein H6807_09255 [Planctomycetes bacterium]|nr:hypothetical protein [Planctomycetota bacterium]
METMLMLVLFLLLPPAGQEEPPKPESRPAAPPLALEVDLPARVDQASLARNGLELVIRLVNEGKEEILVTPWVALEIRDDKGELVKPSRSIGRWGRRPPGCLLERLRFDPVPVGKSVERRCRLADYVFDPGMMTGWKLGKGSYRLRFVYAAKRSALRALCSCREGGHDDPGKPWNKVLELELVAEKTLVVE